MDTQQELHAAMVAALKRDREYYGRKKDPWENGRLIFGRRDSGGIIRHVPTSDGGPPPASTPAIYCKCKGDSRWTPFDPDTSG